MKKFLPFIPWVALAAAGYYVYRKMSVALPEIGRAASSAYIDIVKPSGVYNVAPSAQATMQTRRGAITTTGLTPEYVAAMQGFVRNNPAFTPAMVQKILIFFNWKVGDLPPRGLNNWK